MPARADEIFVADARGDAEGPSLEEASQRHSSPAAWPSPVFELPGSSIAAMAADAAGGAHLALGNAAGAAIANVHQSLAAEASVHRALASQLDSLRAFSDPAAMLAASMDQSAALRANLASNAVAMGAAAVPRSAFGGAGLTLVTDLYRPPAVSATIVLDAFAARPALHDLLPGLGLAESLAETTQSLLRQITSPFHEASQRLLDVHQEMWRVDASRLWVSSATGVVERLRESLSPASGMWGDLQVLFAATTDGAAIDQDRVEAAVDALVGEIPWKAHDPRVRRAIAARAGAERMSPGTVMRQELRAALYLAVTMRDAPQFVRLGAEWVTGDDGRKADLAPHELPIRWFWQWLFAKAIAIAEASLLDRPYADAEDVPARSPRAGRTISVVSLDAGWERANGGRSHELLVVEAADPLAALVARDERDEDAARLLAVLGVASPRQRELLALIAAGHSEADAARRLGMAPSTARAQLHRLRRKAM